LPDADKDKQKLLQMMLSVREKTVLELWLASDSIHILLEILEENLLKRCGL
jgi:hypothetical protein